MPGSELAEAFVRLRVDSTEIKKDVDKGLKAGDGTAAGRKAGSQFGSGFGSSAAAEIKKNSGKIALAGTAAIATIGVASVKMAGDFQASMVRLTTSAGESQKNLKLVSDGVLKLAVSTGTSTEQLSSGLYTIESAGYHGAAGLNVLKAAAQGARAENAALGTVADAVTTVLNDYHLKASDATRATSALVATVASGKTNMELLSGAMSRVLPTAAALHVSFPQIAGDIATLTAHGVSARLATQDLNSVLVALSAPSDKAAKAMQSVGLSANTISSDIGKKGLTATLQELSNAFLQTAGPDGQLLLATLRGLPPAAQGAAQGFLAGTISTKQFNKAIGGLAPAQQDQAKSFVKIASSATGLKENYVAAMTAMLGGTRGLGVALQLTGSNAKTAADDTKTIAEAYNSAGKNVEGWKAVQGTLNFQLSSFSQAAQTTAISLGEKLLPAATSTLGFFAGHRSVFGDLGAAALVTVGGVTALAFAIKGLSTVSTAYAAVSGGAAAVRAFSAAAVAAAGVQKGMAAETLAAAAAQRALTVSTLATGEAEGAAAAAGTVFAVAADGETAAVVSLNVAQKAAAITSAALAAVNPFVWAVAGAAAVAALGVVLVKNSDQTGALVKQYRAQDAATGFNIAGYQKLASQLGSVNDGQSKLSQTVRLSEGPVSLAKNGSAAYSIALGEVTTAQTAAQRTAANLVGQLGELQAGYVITRTQAEGLAAKAGVTAQQLAASGNEGQKALAKVIGWANGAGQATVKADQWANQTGGLTRALQGLANGLLTAQGNELGWQSAVDNAKASLSQSTAGLDGNSAAAVQNRQNVLQSTIAAVQYAQSQDKMHGNIQSASSVLRQQIAFLQSTGDHSKFVTGEIDALRTALDKLKSKSLNIDVHGSGQFTVFQAATGLKGKAAGGLITGGQPGSDSVLSLLMPGEVVVPTSMVRAGAVDHLRGRLPGFAAGGLVPSYVGAPGAAEGAWAAGDVSATTALLEAATAAAAAAAVRKAQAAAAAKGGPGGGAIGPGAAAAQAYAKSILGSYGWASSQFPPLQSLWNGESGWNYKAFNAASGATGIPQALPGSKMASAGADWRTNPATQIRWGMGYIKGRYNNPATAYSDWLARSPHWYAGGTGGAAAGWGVVGEHGQELVQFHGGETVLPHSMTSRILSGTVGMPGYAAGTKPKPLTAAQKLRNQRLAELAGLVALAGKQTTARNKAIASRTLTIDSQMLHDLEHPKDKAGPKRLAAERKSLSAYEVKSARPINLEHAEIQLLRALTGAPADKKYGGPGLPPKPAPAAADPNAGDTGAADGSSAAAATPPPQALPIPTFLAGAGGQGGFVAPGVSASSGLGGQPLGPAVGVIGGPAVPAMAGAESPGGGDVAAAIAAMHRDLRGHLRQLTGVSAAAPIGAATRFADAVNGAARNARQRAAYSVVPGI